MSYFSVAAVSALVAVSAVNALPMPSPGSCAVDLNGSGYSSLAIRPTPCNNQPAIVYLTNGQVVQSLNQQKSGCGYEYNKVKYTDSNGKVYTGWAGSDWLSCNNKPHSGTVTCGHASVQFGGPTNFCGKNAAYTGTDSMTCNGSLSDCQSVCCANLVYRRDTDESADDHPRP